MNPLARGWVVDWQAVAQILDAIAWPAVVVLVLWSSRKPIGRLLERVASTAAKLTLGEYSVELEPLPRVAPEWQAADADVRKLTPSAVFDSASQSLFQQLVAPTPADYAIIDLGSGDQWLSSRLFVFAAFLGRVRGVRALVFAETRTAVRQCFVGVATPDDVRRSLGTRYPWLEAAFARAADPAQYDPKVAHHPFGLSGSYPLQLWHLQTLVRRYVEEIQQPVQPVPVQASEWQAFDSPPQMWERTSWLQGGDVEALLGDKLIRSYVVDSASLDKRGRTLAVLRSLGPFVALVDGEYRFSALVDRKALLERLAVEVAETA